MQQIIVIMSANNIIVIRQLLNIFFNATFVSLELFFSSNEDLFFIGFRSLTVKKFQKPVTGMPVALLILKVFCCPQLNSLYFLVHHVNHCPSSERLTFLCFIGPAS